MLIRLCLFIFLVCPVLGDDVALVTVGDEWRYFKGITNPPERWNSVEFDGAGWGAGLSGFGAYLNGNATAFGDMAGGYVSVYVRKEFVVADAGLVRWLTLRVDYSDGFVAFLNGKEVVRRNMHGTPGTYVPFDATAANSRGRGNPEEIDLSEFRQLLVAGENVLAMQFHSIGLFDFDFGFLPELLANFTRGPYVQNASTTSVQVIWKTAKPTEGWVEFGVNGNLGGKVASSTNATVLHVASLSGLESGRTYQYRVRSRSGGEEAVSPVETFRTLKSEGAIRFAVLGDSGSGSREQMQVARLLRETRPDLVLHAGDIIYPSFTTNQADQRCLSVYREQMKTTPFYFAIGNHDLYSGPEHVLSTLVQPTNSIPWEVHRTAGTTPQHYYSFDHGDVHFTVLFVPYLNQHKLVVGDPQYRWLTNDLATTTRPWKVMLFHVSMDTSGLHRFDDNDGNGIRDRVDIREVVFPVAARYGVQLVMSGHDHNYEKFNPTEGVHSIVTGGGGVGLYNLSELDPASSLMWVRHHCLRVTIDHDRLEAEAVGLNGDIFDRMIIQRTTPVERKHAAQWHSPRIERTQADDQDGNVFGQNFDLVGAGISTYTGRFSNLGIAHVNNDRTNLYIGFRHVMLHGNSTLFLFVDSPRLPGVADLKGLGNGVVDPHGEGADGLDFLGNLAFSGFRPSIGCILGDEYGDGQARRFGRRRLEFNTGQGVFRLTTGLEDVAGIALQQFNLSPQIGAVPGEEDANFIEVSIPLAELGGLRPGEVIKVGALVAGGTIDTNKQTRQLDAGFLGAGFTVNSDGMAVLEGLEVALAIDPDPDDDGLMSEEELLIGTHPDQSDSDGDGLPDGWEYKNQLNPLDPRGEEGASGDPDRDGLSNRDEQLAGTHPRNSRSVLRLHLERMAGSKYRISWQAVPGRRYQLQVSGWPHEGYQDVSDLGFPMTATGPSHGFEMAFENNGSTARYYRISVVP